jgi:hypothetical protein
MHFHKTYIRHLDVQSDYELSPPEAVNPLIVSSFGQFFHPFPSLSLPHSCAGDLYNKLIGRNDAGDICKSFHWYIGITKLESIIVQNSVLLEHIVGFFADL